MDTTPGDGFDAYRPIADYGLIGDMYSAALIASNGAIDWCCWPRFDSEAVFCRLLDADKGGYFQVKPTAPFEVERAYLERTNILQTTFSTEHGQIRLTDFMPVEVTESSGEASDVKDEPRCILRRIEAVSGEVDVEVTVRPSFDWARAQPDFLHKSWGVVARAGEEAVVVGGQVDFEQADPNTLKARKSLRAGDEIWLSVEHLLDARDTSKPPAYADPDAAKEILDKTTNYWRDWIDRCAYDGPYTELVQRGALTLKLLTYAPTGAVIAAPTTSLPEDPGGERNWDYRFVWLRDAGLILRELQDMGYHEEAMDFWDWLENLSLGSGNEMQNIYRVDGGTELPEQCLDHLEGYMGSRPVRIGNAAADQLQVDRYGHIIDAAHICQTRMREPHPKLEPALRFLAKQAVERWREPDHGIWEMRSEPRHFVHSKLRCWVALDRALRLAERGWLDGDTERWRENRDELREVIEQRGFNDELGAFTQTLDGDALDATALMIPLVEFLPATDERVQSTIDCIQERLVVDGLVHRYQTPDGLSGDEGAFVMCSFWLVSALAESGRTDEAHELFKQVAAHANNLGLLAEEIEPREKKLLGNFPQGFSHLALTDAALRLAKQ